MKQSFFVKNRKKYFDSIEYNSLTIINSGYVLRQSADEEFPFEVDKNFYYLTGINQEEVIYMMLKENNEMKEMLFIVENDPIKVKWVGAKLYKDEATAISGIKDVHYTAEYKDILPKMMEKVNKVYLNLEKVNWYRFNPNYSFSCFIMKNYPDKEFIDNDKIVIRLRSVKEKEEIEKIQESVDVTKIGVERLMQESKPGLYEYQLESYFDYVIKNNGQRIHSFKTIAASGKNATILHYVANDSILKDGDLVLFDLGTETEFYISDISRTFPVNGKFTPRQKEVYEAVLEVNKKSIEFLKPGVSKKEYNDYAKDLLTKACYKLGLITKDEDIIKYYWHSVGHSIGLDTHDPCDYNEPFEEGMLVTCEPGLYIEEENIGVRIEDDILITKDGALNLSKDIIKEVEDIENFMKNKRS